MLMRDPLIYRVLHHHHHRTGNDWKIYPMYDFAHGESDYIEQISHSICTLEFVMHRDYIMVLDQIYDTKLDHISMNSRLNLNYTVMSKRKLLQLVQENIVNGWDDPRMPTISG
jgi:glutaminyl-tRNA synthetase